MNIPKMQCNIKIDSLVTINTAYSHKKKTL